MKGTKGKGMRYKQRSAAGGSPKRALTSISILAIVFVLCLWVPLALADSGETTPAAGTDAAEAAAVEQPAVDAVADVTDTAAGTSDSLEAAGSAPADEPADTTAGTAVGESGASADDAGSAPGGDAAPATVASDYAASTAVLAEAGSDCDAANAAETEYGAGCVPEYKLDLICGWGNEGTYWENMDDYNAGLLSILYHLENNGTGTAYNLNITSATATNGVTLATDLASIVLGDLAPDEAINFILKWLVPKDVGHYVTTVEICADCEQPICPEGECPPVDPCIENPELCQPVDPCLEDPTLCNPIDPGDIGPTPTPTPTAVTATTAAPVFARTELPSTGFGMLPVIAAALTLLATGLLISISMRSHRNHS